MAVIGFVPSPDCVLCAAVSGVSSAPIAVPLSIKKLTVPKAGDETIVLAQLRRSIGTLLGEVEISKIVVLKAGQGQFRGASPLRIKIEAVIQLVAADAGIAIVLLSPQTLRTREKKFCQTTGATPETIFNKGKAFSPKPWADAILTAWAGHDL